jgi:hypothetical protein
MEDHGQQHNYNQEALLEEEFASGTKTPRRLLLERSAGLRMCVSKGRTPADTATVPLQVRHLRSNSVAPSGSRTQGALPFPLSGASLLSVESLPVAWTLADVRC